MRDPDLRSPVRCGGDARTCADFILALGRVVTATALLWLASDCC
jgi:hypothetical protein